MLPGDPPGPGPGPGPGAQLDDASHTASDLLTSSQYIPPSFWQSLDNSPASWKPCCKYRLFKYGAPPFKLTTIGLPLKLDHGLTEIIKNVWFQFAETVNNAVCPFR